MNKVVHLQSACAIVDVGIGVVVVVVVVVVLRAVTHVCFIKDERMPLRLLKSLTLKTVGELMSLGGEAISFS